MNMTGQEARSRSQLTANSDIATAMPTEILAGSDVFGKRKIRQALDFRVCALM